MASFLDSITDVFTGRPGVEQAQKTQDFIRGQQAGVDARLAAAQSGGLGALKSAREGALGAIGPGFDLARSDISGATPQAIAALMRGETLGAGALTGAQDPALAALNFGVDTAKGAYAPLQAAAGRYGAAGGEASQASADALGLNGPEGLARAKATFQATPGFEFQLGTGVDALTRAANVGGMSAGGNVLAEAQKFGSGLAAQEFDKYRQALAGREQLYGGLESGALSSAGGGISTAGLTGGTAGANILTGTGGRLADLYSTTGGRAADVYGTEGRSLADLASKGGLAEAGVFTGIGTSEADLMAKLAGYGTTFAGNTLAPFGNAGQMAATAEMQGSKNLWDLGVAGAKLFAGIPPTGGAGSTPMGYGRPF